MVYWAERSLSKCLGLTGQRPRSWERNVQPRLGPYPGLYSASNSRGWSATNYTARDCATCEADQDTGTWYNWFAGFTI